MVTSSLNRMIRRDLKNLIFQIFTTALLLVCGVSILVSSWSSYLSLKKARDDYYNTSRFADIFAEFKTAPVDVVKKIRSIPGVDSVDGRIMTDGLVHVTGMAGPAVGRFLTFPQDRQSLNNLFLIRGAYPSQSHVVEVNVHEAFAKAHDLSIGDYLNVIIQGNSEKVKIVGIVVSPEFVDPINPSAPLPDNRHFGVFWVPQKQLEYLAKMQNQVNSIIVKISKDARPDSLMTHINQVLARFGNRGAYQRKHQLSNMFIEDEIRQQRVTAIILPLIFLSIAAFLVNIIISRLITLQKSEIATLKALGYSDMIITYHYTKLILVMLAAGCFPGIGLGGLLGTLLIKNYRHFFHFPELTFSVSASAIILGFIAGFLPGIMSMVITLRSIFNLTPAEAMRPPSPPEFLPSVFEKWNLQRFFNVRSRLVIRNLLLRPIRIVLLIFGLSTSIAIIITARSWLDMIGLLHTTQFSRLQREDVTVTLQSPVPYGALRDFLRIKGILEVETVRSLPIRLRYRDKEREISLQALSDKSQMTRLLDKELQDINIPHDGIQLSAFFRDHWGLRKGDLVEVEFLEGELRKKFLKVSGFSEDLIGISSHIDSHFLAQVLREGPCFNIVKLKVDPHQLDEIYKKLRTLPLINTIMIKEQLKASFMSTIAGMVKVFTYVLITFALAITVGILYNSVRITFSERSSEMAILMILGFNKWPVFNLLASEVVIEVMLAIIPGSVCGWGLAWLSTKLIHAETFEFPVIIEIRTYALSILFVFLVMFLSLTVTFRMLRGLKLLDALKVRE